MFQKNNCHFFLPNSAQVACRQLGFSHAGSFQNAAVDGTGDIVLDDLGCAGSERTLTHCAHVTTHNCGHDEDIAITCKPLRLVASPKYNEGIAKIFYRNVQEHGRMQQVEPV
jgi:hypothetical protein